MFDRDIIPQPEHEESPFSLLLKSNVANANTHSLLTPRYDAQRTARLRKEHLMASAPVARVTAWMQSSGPGEWFSLYITGKTAISPHRWLIATKKAKKLT
jgi:hypothetical protein